MESKTKYQIILSACPDQNEAERIAVALVEDNIAAAVNIVPGVKSVFRWDGEVKIRQESLLLIKGRTDNYHAIEQKIQLLHSYELPGIVAIPIVMGFKPYLEWLNDR